MFAHDLTEPSQKRIEYDAYLYRVLFLFVTVPKIMQIHLKGFNIESPLETIPVCFVTASCADVVSILIQWAGSLHLGLFSHSSPRRPLLNPFNWFCPVVESGYTLLFFPLTD